MVDIVIRAKNGHNLTGKCISSISDHDPDQEKTRIILVEDGGDPFPHLPTRKSHPQLDGVSYDQPDIRVSCSRSSGAVTASNLGLAVSLQFTDSDYVMIMDNDTQVPDGDDTWLERLLAEINQDSRCAAVGATTTKANPPQHILTVPQTYTADWSSEDGKTGGSKANPDVPWFVSFCVLLRKSAVRDVGFWDETYNPGNYEDTDYAMQLRRAGWTVRVARSVYIHHVGHQTFSDDLQRLLKENKMKFIEKWGPGALADAGMIAPAEAVEFYKAAGLVG